MHISVPYLLKITIFGSVIGNRKELQKLFYSVFMPCTIFRDGEFCYQQFLVIEPVAYRDMLPNISPQLAVKDADHHHREGIVLMA